MNSGEDGGRPKDQPEDYQQHISSIQKLFSEYDHEGTGKVKVSLIPELVACLGRDVAVGRQVAKRINQTGNLDLVSFEEVVQALKAVEEGRDQEMETTTPLTLLKRLHGYRKRCEDSKEYVEAQKARRKYEELRKKEEERQRRLVGQAQSHEMNEVEQAQKQQFLGFSAAWDKYMADYESTAYMSLERLKEQHAAEFALIMDKFRNQPARPHKSSRELLDLRSKQEALAKLGNYEEAYKVKEAADHLEEWEIARSASVSNDSVQRIEDRASRQQEKALAALLKRIQRDRGEQIRHRQLDSQRLIQRNKNLKVDLAKKQHLEFQRAEAAIRSIMSQPEHAQKLLDENDPAYVARSAALGELPTLGKIKWKGPCLPEKYVPPGGVSKGLVRTRDREGKLLAGAPTRSGEETAKSLYD